MSTPSRILLSHLHRLAAPAAADAVLLARWTQQRDQAAFAALMARHGPMVLGVCRRLLRDEQEAEDVFQAVFVVLSRQAARLRQPEALAGFLHTVAVRLARKARKARRRQRMQTMADTPEPIDPRPHPLDALSGRELLALLDAEIARLPEVYRLPLLLCLLQGRTIEEAARQLGWTIGSLRGRLVRGREQLRRRLTGRGLDLSVGAVALLAPVAVPEKLLAESLRHLSGPVPAAISVLAGGMMPALKVKIVGLVVVLAAAVGLGAGLSLRGTPEPQTPAAPSPAAPPSAQSKNEPRRDRYGDPLPPGVLARLGTPRLCHPPRADWIAFAPDGKTLVSMDYFGSTVRIWDVATGELIGQFEPSGSRRGYGRGYGATPSFSPGGELLAVSVHDGSVRLWDVRARRWRHTVKGAGTSSSILAFSPDGHRLAGVSAGNGGETLYFIDPVKGEVVARRGNLPPLAFLTYTPDGKTLVSASPAPRDRTTWNVTFCRWDAETGRKRGEHVYTTGETCANGALSPDGQFFAMPLKGGTTIQLIDTRTGEELRRTEGEASWAYRLTFSGDSRFLTAISDDGIVRVWETATGKRVHRFRGLSPSISSVALSHKGNLLALVGRADWAVHVWDLTRERELHAFPGHRGGRLTLAYSPDGKTIATTSRDDIQSGTVVEWGDWSLRRWDAATGEERGVTRRNPGGEVRLTVFSPDGRLLATVINKGILRLWDTASGEELRRWQVPVEEGTDRHGTRTVKRWLLHIHALVFTHDGRTVLATDGEKIYRWDTATGIELPAWKLGSRDPNVTWSVSPDDRTLLVYHYGRSTGWRLISVDLATGQELRHPLPQRIGGVCPVFSPDGRTLAVPEYVPAPREVVLLEAESGQERARLACHSQVGPGLVFSSDGRLLASGCHGDGRVRLWDLSAESVVRELAANSYYYATRLAFSSDNSRLATAGFENTVQVWDISGFRKRGEAAPTRLSPDELESLWRDLSGVSARRAYRAIWKLAAAPRQSVPFLKGRLKKVPLPVDDKHLAKLLAKLIGDLDDDRFPVREKASQELESLGPKAERALRQALTSGPSAEAKRRIQHLLERLASKDALTPPSAELIALRVLEALEKSDSPEAREVIGELARGRSDSRLTREASLSLRRLAKRPAGQ